MRAGGKDEGPAAPDRPDVADDGVVEEDGLVLADDGETVLLGLF